MAPQVCIIIQTNLEERGDWLAHRVIFLEQAGHRGEVLVGVWGGHDRIDEIRKRCEAHVRSFTLTFVAQDGDVFPVDRLIELAKSVDCPYIAIQGDDDFFMPETLAAAAAVLESDAGVGCAHGRYVNLDLPTIAGTQHYSFFPNWEALEDDALDRFAALMKHYAFTWHAVYRSAHFIRRAELMRDVYDESGNAIFCEMIGDLYSVIIGKIWVLEDMYAVRGEHSGSNSKVLRQGGIRYNMPPYMLLADDFSSAYKVFERYCVNLFREVGVDVEDERVQRRIADGMLACLGRLIYKLRDRLDPGEVEFQKRCRAGVDRSLNATLKLMRDTFPLSVPH
jgi:glycosyltransferase domain-containing protein